MADGNSAMQVQLCPEDRLLLECLKAEAEETNMWLEQIACAFQDKAVEPIQQLVAQTPIKTLTGVTIAGQSLAFAAPITLSEAPTFAELDSVRDATKNAVASVGKLAVVKATAVEGGALRLEAKTSAALETLDTAEESIAFTEAGASKEAAAELKREV